MNLNARLVLFSMLALSGCAGIGDDETIGETTEELINPNGVKLNGVKLNGTNLNGASLATVNLNGVDLSGVTLNSANVTGVTVQASKLDGTRSGAHIQGAGFVGAHFVGALSDGATLNLRIDSATLLASPNNDTWAYGVSYQSTSGWQFLCGVDTSSAEQLAIAVPGTFNYGTGVTGGGSYTADATKFTFGCRATAIAKCIEFGYKYWKPIPSDGGHTLQNHMLACTRLLRADYCGDGNSWTVDGTPVDLYDSHGIQADQTSWPLEAEWSPNGANCMSPTNYLRWQNTSSTAPACFAAKKSAACGLFSDFATTSTLIMDEYLH